MLTDVLKQEHVGYLKSKLNLMNGILSLTKTQLVLEAYQRSVEDGGLFRALFKKKNDMDTEGFAFDLHTIKTSRGKHGFNKNVLEVTDANGISWRILVKDYTEWESLLKQS
ncbi:MAG: hypothetical protein K0S33_2965 [Bacteroidetes bacterium]|jgi:hypothetical protein|nr:hypothetical protein [Bacteroidota bacterium]